jgi:hypothetical protein
VLRGIEARLRRLEAAKPHRLVFFVIWGSTDEEVAAAYERASAAGKVRDGDPVIPAIWPGEDIPESRWVGLDDLSEKELEALLAHLLSMTPDAPRTGTGANPALRRMTDNELFQVVLGSKR